MPRYWTLEEARAALPDIVGLLRELRGLAEQAAGAPSRSSTSPRTASAGPARSVNGHGSASPQDPLARARRLLEEITGRGIQVKDISTGLIDFPYLRDGVEVLLCYRLGEDDIGFWHELQTGFAGRRPLSEL
jgi:hypothetical protein